MPKAARLRCLDAVLIGLLFGGSVLSQAASFHKTAVAGEPVAVLFAPWVGATSAFERIAVADARIIRAGTLPFIVIAEPASDGFGRRIGELGAWMTLDPVAIAACLNAFGGAR